MTVNIGVLGCCASRDAFNSNFMPNYKYFFNISCYQFQMSFMSLMSKSIPYDTQRIEGKADRIDKEHLDSELSKPILSELIINQPKYVIIDFFADVMFGAVETSGSLITNKVFKFKDIEAEKNLRPYGMTYNPRRDLNSFLEKWKESFDQFVTFSNINLPNTKLIINKVRLGWQYYDTVANVFRLIEPSKNKEEHDYLNRVWNDLDNHVIEKYHLKNIDYNNKIYYCDPHHLWGKQRLHFMNNYYRDFTDKLLKIIFDNYEVINEKRNMVSHINLIRNSTFKFGNSFWGKWDHRFIIENESLHLISKEQINERNYQVWSNNIEINGDGDNVYSLSFDLKVNGIDIIDGNKMIFCIRTFKHRDVFDQASSINHFNLKIDDFDIKDRQWNRYVFKFKPAGRFIRVAPYLQKNGDIEWKKIQLEKSNESTPWKEAMTE